MRLLSGSETQNTNTNVLFDRKQHRTCVARRQLQFLLLRLIFRTGKLSCWISTIELMLVTEEQGDTEEKYHIEP